MHINVNIEILDAPVEAVKSLLTNETMKYAEKFTFSKNNGIPISNLEPRENILFYQRIVDAIRDHFKDVPMMTKADFEKLEEKA